MSTKSHCASLILYLIFKYQFMKRYSFPLRISLGRDRTRIKFNCSRTINNCVNHYTSDMRTYVPHLSHYKKNVYTYAVSCSLSTLKPILTEAQFASRSQESFLLRGGGKAREEKRGRRESKMEDRGEKEDRSGALLSLQSRVRPHSFICSAAEVLNLRCEIPDDHPPSALGAIRARIWVVCLCIVHCMHMYALLCMRRNSDSHNWRRHLSGWVVLSRYGPAKIYALCNCAITVNATSL